MDIQYIGNDTYACVYDGIVMIEKTKWSSSDKELQQWKSTLGFINGRHELIKRISNIIFF